MIDKEYWIWFSRIDNLTPKILNELLEKFKSPKKLFEISKEELLLAGIKEKYINEIIDTKYKLKLQKYSQYMNQNSIDIITINDKEYPDTLKLIYDPPVVLYVKGNKEILKEKAVSMVGCRLCTTYGEKVARKLAYDLSLNNINVVSGLARGVDSFAHEGALDGKNGKTIAVVRMWIKYCVPNGE